MGRRKRREPKHFLRSRIRSLRNRYYIVGEPLCVAHKRIMFELSVEGRHQSVEEIEEALPGLAAALQRYMTGILRAGGVTGERRVPVIDEAEEGYKQKARPLMIVDGSHYLWWDDILADDDISKAYENMYEE